MRSAGVFRQSIFVKFLYLVAVFTLAYVGYQLFQVQGVLLGIIIASGIHSVMMLMVCQRHSGYELSELARRISPSITLAALLIAKNILIIPFVQHSTLTLITTVIASDILVIAILLSTTFFIGQENRSYIQSRFGELSSLIQNKLKR